MTSASQTTPEATASLSEWRGFAGAVRKSRPGPPNDVEIIWAGNTDWQPTV